jgi:hypothetical protein
MQQIFNKAVHNSLFLAFFLLLAFHMLCCFGGEIFKWVDEEGTVHMTDSLSNIPPQYRDQVVKKTLENANETPEDPDSLRNAPERNTAGFAFDLKRFEVPFRAFEGASRRIIIPATLNESVTAHLLLDTGAPGLTISPNLANRLGLLNEQDGNLLIRTGGIGGSIPAFLVVVDTVRVGEALSEFLPAVITQIPSDDFEGLVGMDFMANYKISIDNNSHVVAFDELPPQPEKPGGHDEAWWRSIFRTIAKLREEWRDYLDEVSRARLTSSETDRILKAVKNQCIEADKIYRKLESYARDKAVPIAWRR